MQREESLSQEKSPLHEATWARVSRLGEERAADMQTQNSQPSLPAGSRGERTRVPAPGCHHVVSELYRTHLSVWERQKPQRRLTGTPSSASAPLPDGRDGLSGYDRRLLRPLPRGLCARFPARTGGQPRRPGRLRQLCAWGAFSSRWLQRARRSLSFFATCLCVIPQPQPNFPQGLQFMLPCLTFGRLRAQHHGPWVPHPRGPATPASGVL